MRRGQFAQIFSLILIQSSYLHIKKLFNDFSLSFLTEEMKSTFFDGRKSNNFHYSSHLHILIANNLFHLWLYVRIKMGKNVLKSVD